MLKTLGYRIPADRVNELLGDVFVHGWDDNPADAWDRLPRRRSEDGAPTRPAYRQLRTGLVAAHGRPVHVVDSWNVPVLDRDAGLKGMILSAGPLKPFHLKTCVQTFERLLRGDRTADTLAPLLGATEPVRRRFSDYLGSSTSGTVTAPGWVFETAAWSVAERLAQPLRLEDGGPEITLRMDTDGCLIGWDDLVWNEWSQGRGYAMLRIIPTIITLPRSGDLGITFDAHLSRIATAWYGNKTAWIDRKEAGAPVLRVPVRNIPPTVDGGEWRQEVADFGAAIAESCSVEALDLDAELPAKPGRVRPLIRGPLMHPVGKGPGARLMLRVAEHIDRLCTELEPLAWEKDSSMNVPAPRRQRLGRQPAKKSAADKEPNAKVSDYSVLPETIVNAVRAGSRKRGEAVRLMCLYATSEARARMSTQLETLAPGATPKIDGETSPLCDGFDVSFHRVVELLRHGSHDRAGLLTDIDRIRQDFSGTILALVETEYDARTGKPKDDAKNLVKDLLVERGINPQFLATKPEPIADDKQKPRKRTAKKASTAQTGQKTDHAAANAFADLMLRTAGVIHPSLGQSALAGFLDGAPTTKVQLVGLHMRSQQSRRPNTPPRFVTTVVDVEASSNPAAAWPVRMWSDTDSGWTGYPQGLASYHAGPIGSREHGRGNKAVATRLYVESILDALPAGPVVLFVDASSTRSFWPGLQNHEFMTGLLPGVNLGARRNVAIVRCNSGQEIPRPVDRTGGRQPADHRKPATPERYVYREGESGIWLFGKSSKSYRAKGGRTGAEYTPWTVPEDLRFLLQEDWHSYTATEIAVARSGEWEERQLVTLTARLCDHTVAWDDRTLTPLPLHLASRADITHPDFRTPEEE